MNGSEAESLVVVSPQSSPQGKAPTWHGIPGRMRGRLPFALENPVDTSLSLSLSAISQAL